MYAFRVIMGKLWAVIFFEARYLLVLAKWQGYINWYSSSESI